MRFYTIALISLIIGSVSDIKINAQEVHPRWYIGAGGGVHFSNLIYSNLDKEYFPENKFNLSGVFSVFAEVDFGRQNMFAVRPQISFLTRGGKLTQIGRNYYEGYFNPVDNPASLLEDVSYTLKAQCFDVRVPLIWQMGRDNWRFRPYLYVAPILSVVNNGYISAANHFADGSFDGYRYKLSDANMSSLIFSAAAGVGCKYQFEINNSPFFIGLEVGYERSFTNTYGTKEKNGEAEGISFFPGVKNTEGTRLMQAIEVQMSIGIPLSVFSKKKNIPVVQEVAYSPVVVEEPEEIFIEEPECYSLDEIINLLNAGRSVEGLKICAIDEINFEFGKSELSKSSYSYLKKLANVLKRTNAKVVINGHTDNVGTPEFNLELSRKRAVSVRDYLVNQGVDGKKLTYRYYGMTKPLTDNDTEDGRKLNRRVEFEIQK